MVERAQANHLQSVAEVARTLQMDIDLAQALDDIAAHFIPLLDIDAVSVILHGSTPVAAAAVPRYVAEVSSVQIASGGPGLEAMRRGEVVNVIDLAAHAGRWRDYPGVALGLGLRSVLAVPLTVDEHLVGAVELFSAEVKEWSADELDVARVLADVTAIRIANTRFIERQADLAKQLQGALDSRVVIEQAKGVLAATEGIGLDEAFERIRHLARRTNTRISEVAQDVVQGRCVPGSVRTGGHSTTLRPRSRE